MYPKKKKRKENAKENQEGYREGKQKLWTWRISFGENKKKEGNMTLSLCVCVFFSFGFVPCGFFYYDSFVEMYEMTFRPRLGYVGLEGDFWYGSR